MPSSNSNTTHDAQGLAQHVYPQYYPLEIIVRIKLSPLSNHISFIFITFLQMKWQEKKERQARNNFILLFSLNIQKQNDTHEEQETLVQLICNVLLIHQTNLRKRQLIIF